MNIQNSKHITFCFGRFNPPNFGHSVVFETVKNVAGINDWVIFTSKSHDSKNNPLTYTQKLHWLYTIHPCLQTHIIENTEIKTYLQAASYLYNQGYRSATFVAGSEDIDSMKGPLLIYNGIPNRHGFYHFEPLNFVTSPSPNGRSTDARNAAKNNNLVEFQRIVNIKDIEIVENLMKDVQSGMKLSSNSFI